MKTVHFHINTATGPFSSKSDHASYTTVSCDQTENCDFYKQGQCAKLGLFHNCPYGKHCRVRGPTRRAQTYSKFVSDARDRHKDIPSLQQISGDKLAIVGEYVYLPLNWLSNYVNPIDLKIEHEHFIRRADLAPETVVKLCAYRPEALFGGEIKTYQKTLHVFLRGMRDRLPELLQAAVALDPILEARLAEITNVGRPAVLETLKPGIGEFMDCHKAHWKWDGTYLTSTDSRANFMLINNFTEIRVKPVAGAVVKITDDGQVTESTRFTD